MAELCVAARFRGPPGVANPAEVLAAAWTVWITVARRAVAASPGAAS